MFTWVKGNAYSLVLTLYDNNITLNSAATSYFEDIRWCMLGIDQKNHSFAIKPVSKRDIDLGLVDKKQLHKVSIGKGYGRISSKVMMEQIAEMMHVTLNGVKVEAYYDDEENMIVADLLKVDKGV